ncbi:hypothetical protein [Streptomyces gilvus]|uniref:hypothetical protein n=1 Tax=Streptomyces gilvus TaxID=2920937 RepID=UPI001F11852D|nr:hypothetical protein [Streptomyces sp. CME 23]MCH5676133.1 hypothetical protein [Streptomyces sp. CME 23]
MDSVDHRTAWEHPPTRRAWGKQLAINVAAFFAWTVSVFALLAVLAVFLGPGYAIIIVPFLVYSFHRAFLQLFIIPWVFQMRRVLRAYPWQLVREASYGLAKRTDVIGRQFGWFEFPNPARPDEKLPLVFSRHWGVGWWHRRMAPRAASEIKAQIGVVWFAGDPRFIGVIAAPSANGTMPRRFRFLHQQTPAVGGLSVTDWGATDDDIERGRRAGVRPAGM